MCCSFFYVINYNFHWCNVTLNVIRNFVRIYHCKIIDIAQIKVFDIFEEHPHANLSLLPLYF